MAKRRARGEGTVRQRPDGKWEGYTPRDEYGKRIKRVAATQREALQRLAEARHQQKQGIGGADAKQPLSVFAPWWLEHVARPEVADSTYESYASTIRLHLLTKPIARISPEKLQRRHVRDWHTALAKDHARTADYARMILGNMLNYCIDEQWIEQNVAHAVRRRKRTNRTIPARAAAPLTPLQARYILQAIRGERLEALYLLILCTGMRRGEPLAFRVGVDVDLDARLVTVAGTLRRTLHTLKRKDSPKSKAGRRTMQIPAFVADALRAYREQVAAEREQKLLIDDWKETEYFFVTTRGTPIEPRNLLRGFQRMLARWNATHPQQQIPPLTLHKLRHAAATFLGLLRVEPRVAMEILGHANIKTTLEIYTHVLDESKAAALDQMGAMLTADEPVVLEIPSRQKSPPNDRDKS